MPQVTIRVSIAAVHVVVRRLVVVPRVARASPPVVILRGPRVIVEHLIAGELRHLGAMLPHPLFVFHLLLDLIFDQLLNLHAQLVGQVVQLDRLLVANIVEQYLMMVRVDLLGA